MSQFERSKALREEYRALFSKLVELRERYTKLLDEAQNPPPQGAADGSLGEERYNQDRAVEKATQKLLVALCFENI